MNDRWGVAAAERADGRRSRGAALAASTAAHGVALALAIWLGSGSRTVPQEAAVTARSERLVWLVSPGPAGGGGGGGNRTPRPPRPIERRGDDRLSVPAAAAPTPQPAAPPPPEPVQIDARPLALGQQAAPGVMQPQTVETTSLGDGALNGAGSGRGTGSGDGTGSGLGPGSGGGAGGGVYRGGSGVTSPALLVRVPPEYTADAMRARLQGIVVLECVVDVDGRCRDVRVVRSLDRSFGLDQKAIDAARKWVFRPGQRLGEPVPVPVTLEMEFALR